ncbi:hypothetical protein L596_002473 [Steinernema carpocapsae]|uniref:Uncharacterized protein n=1 Tax=Steinernema carpocapsae TaxID=34508 RepID=A0A4V6I7Q9_STECR|nr:hypothetical protein L596_002473 [Steinernema carpocapsae]
MLDRVLMACRRHSVHKNSVGGTFSHDQKYRSGDACTRARLTTATNNKKLTVPLARASGRSGRNLHKRGTTRAPN